MERSVEMKKYMVAPGALLVIVFSCKQITNMKKENFIQARYKPVWYMWYTVSQISFSRLLKFAC